MPHQFDCLRLYAPPHPVHMYMQNLFVAIQNLLTLTSFEHGFTWNHLKWDKSYAVLGKILHRLLFLVYLLVLLNLFQFIYFSSINLHHSFMFQTQFLFLTLLLHFKSFINVFCQFFNFLCISLHFLQIFTLERKPLVSNVALIIIIGLSATAVAVADLNKSPRSHSSVFVFCMSRKCFSITLRCLDFVYGQISNIPTELIANHVANFRLKKVTKGQTYPF